MILSLEVVFASIAAILSILSFKTLRDIRHLGIGKSFWWPVFLSSAIFLIGSAITILHELDVSLAAQTVELVQVSRIIALNILMVGVYSYSRKIKGSLKEEFSVPEHLIQERRNLASLNEDSMEFKQPIIEETIHERAIEKDLETHTQTKTTVECKHRFGYLRTLPKNASIPDECLSCDRIIECKHSLEEKLEKQPHTV